MKKAISLLSAICVAGLGVGLLSACQDIPSVYLGGEIASESEHTHSWGEGEVTTAATCTTDGVKTYTCECGETKTEVIPATGHTWSAAVYSVDETSGKVVWTRTCSVCGETETLGTEQLPADVTLSADSEEALVAGLTVDGATVVLAPTVEEGSTETPTVEVTDSLTIAPAEGEESISVTIQVDDGVTLGVSDDADLTSGSSENKSTPGLIDVQSGASLTLELGEGSTITGASGDAYESSSANQYHDGLISVADGGSIVISADNSADITQTNPYGAVINIDVGGSCEINGGRYSVEGAQEYTVVNDGNMVINNGIFVTTNAGSSLIINGDDHDTAGYSDHTHSLVINGGEFYGGRHVVKNSLHGYLEINNDAVFDGFLGTYYDDNGNEVPVDASKDLIDNEDATTVINGGTFGAGSAEMITEGETGQFEVTITVKGGHDESETGLNDGYTSTVTINGGTFYKGSVSLFAFGDARKSEDASALDQLLIVPEVYSAVEDDLDSTSYEISSEVNEEGYYVISGAAAE